MRKPVRRNDKSKFYSVSGHKEQMNGPKVWQGRGGMETGRDGGLFVDERRLVGTGVSQRAKMMNCSANEAVLTSS